MTEESKVLDLGIDASLLEIVNKLQVIDSGSVEITEAEHLALGELIRTKVDGCYHFIKHLEERITRHKEMAQEHKDHQKYLEAHLDRFKEYIVFTMDKGGFEKLPGNEFQFSVRTSEETVIHRDPTADDAEHLPEFCKAKTTYAWDKTAIKNAMKSGKMPLDVAGIRINRNLQGKVKK